MQIGDEEVLTLKQASERIGVSVTTQQQQAKKGVLRAHLMGKTWLVTATEIARYEREHKGRTGFAAESHPLHGKRGGGGRRKKTDD
jgi:excisionase family DNA binding protein